jgi:flagellar hook-length control protein FliK
MSLPPRLNALPSSAKTSASTAATAGTRAQPGTAALHEGGFAQALSQAQQEAPQASARPGDDTAEAPHAAPRREDRTPEPAPDGSLPRPATNPSQTLATGLVPRAGVAASRGAATSPGTTTSLAGVAERPAQAVAGQPADNTPEVAALATPRGSAETLTVPAAGPLLPAAAAGAAQGLTSPMNASAHAALPAAEATLAAHPESAAFAAELSAQLTTFVRQGVEHARLHLHPAELGPVDVRIQVEGDSARVVLAADQAPTRLWLEQALPSLAGSLREAGLTLAGGGVFERSTGGGADGGRPASDGRRENREREADMAASASLPRLARRRGVVDLVA